MRPPVKLTSLSSNRSRHMCRLVDERCNAAAYLPTRIPVQFTAFTCSAQDAWTARLRTSVLTEKRSRTRLYRRFARSSRRF